MTVKLSSALRAFLPRHSAHNADLVARILEYESETTILPVRQGEHEGHNLFNLVYPKDAKTQPAWSDDHLPYPLEFAAEIGSSGFSAGGSVYVAFDIDTLVGHSQGLTDAEIDNVISTLSSLPYAEIRRSTRGSGLHVYVWFEPLVPTANHDEHAAVARAVHGKISFDANLNFGAAVNVYGRNTWYWSTRATEVNGGYRQIKAATTKLSESDLSDWRDHIPVVQRKQAKVSTTYMGDTCQTRVRRDAEHDRILEEYQRHGYALTWVPDHGLFRVHTVGLQKTHEALKLKGMFRTISERSPDEQRQNAFMFLLPKGAFRVYRYGTNEEDRLWETQGDKVTCTLNVALTPATICRAVQAVPFNSTDFSCYTVKKAMRAAQLLDLKLPPMSDRPVNVEFKDNTVTFTAERSGKEIVPGWAAKGRSLKFFRYVDFGQTEQSFDNQLRRLVTPDNNGASWLLRRADGSWGQEEKENCRDVVDEEAFGCCVSNPWYIVNEPFAGDVLPGRRQNVGRKLIDPAPGSHPLFDSILAHIGRDLDSAVVADPWCQQFGVKSGADWLRLWAATVVQAPKRKLPALFIWSTSNNTGKSSFHRALSMLIKGDDGAADVYLALSENFNKQLAGTVLGYIEDKAIDAKAYARVKGWIDSPTIAIRSMRTDVYTLPNYLHLIHTANRLDAVPLESTDERYVVIHVPNKPERDVPWHTEMEPALRREAPHILDTLLTTILPPATGRLSIPVLDTESKRYLTRRSLVDPTLFQRLLNIIDSCTVWEGAVGELGETLGNDSPSTFSQQLAYMAPALSKRGVGLVMHEPDGKGRRTIEVGYKWALEETL